jgi:hypothetical protein
VYWLLYDFSVYTFGYFTGCHEMDAGSLVLYRDLKSMTWTMLYHMSYLCGVRVIYPRVEVVPLCIACPSFHLLSFHTGYTSSSSFLTTLDILPTRKAAEEEVRL